MNSNDEIFAASYYEGLFKSSDYGDTWDFLPVNTIEDIFIDSKDVIYIASDNTGIHRSYDNGETWEDISSGLGTVAHQFAPAPDGHLYCRGGYSLFRTTDIVLDTGKSIPEEISVYPNPSKEYIIIETTELPFYLSVTDLTGKEIYNTSISSFKSQIDLSNQPAGIYFIKISNKEHSITKKIIISN